LRPEIALLAHLLAGTPLHAGFKAVPLPAPWGRTECPGLSAPALLGLLARPLTLAEMVDRLEQGCLALDQVRFRPGQDTIESLSPAQFALVARALGLARGAYRVTVPAEASPGWPPDTVQARRRGTRLRDELVHYGASLGRLLEDPGLPLALAVPAGTAVPMLVRVPDS
jgi:hypothetical protein